MCRMLDSAQEGAGPWLYNGLTLLTDSSVRRANLLAYVSTVQSTIAYRRRLVTASFESWILPRFVLKPMPLFGLKPS